MTTEIDQKLADLQALSAYQDNQIQELNEVVTKQWGEIDALKKYMQMTKSKLEELENTMSDRGQDDSLSSIDEAAANKPPHY